MGNLLLIPIAYNLQYLRFGIAIDNDDENIPQKIFIYIKFQFIVGGGKCGAGQ